MYTARIVAVAGSAPDQNGKVKLNRRVQRRFLLHQLHCCCCSCSFLKRHFFTEVIQALLCVHKMDDLAWIFIIIYSNERVTNHEQHGMNLIGYRIC